MKVGKQTVEVSPRELSENFYQINGIVYWKKKYKRFKSGQVAGCITGAGYWYIEFKRNRYPRSKIVWCLVNGSWPEAGKILDHINRNKLDDSISNLRCVSTKENCYNRGARGYFWETARSKWTARIKTDTKHLLIGRYDTEEEAKAAYNSAKLKYHQIGEAQEHLTDREQAEEDPSGQLTQQQAFSRPQKSERSREGLNL